MKVVAHRTCPRDAPENSLEGIAVAAAAGANYVEVDVRLTRDGVPVLLHDPLLLRTTGLPLPVRWTSSDRVARTRLKGGREPVPTLAAALAALPDAMGMAIDLKDPAAAEATLAAVGRAGCGEKVLLWAQSNEGAAYFVAHAPPGAEVALLRDTFDEAAHERFLDDAIRLGVAAISAHPDVVTSVFVAEASGRGLGVYAWVRDVSAHAEKMAAGLRGFVTDFPREARAALG